MITRNFRWIGVYQQGLASYRDGRVALVGPAQGLPSDTIGTILEDGRGWLWMGTSRGILRMARSELHRAEPPATPKAYELFNTSDGLDSDYCNEGNQPNAARDQAGRLWFGTDRGVVMVDPVRLRLNTLPPPVFVERVTFRDRSGTNQAILDPRDPPLLIPAGSSDLAFNFSALSFAAPDKVSYKYCLEGANAQWIGLGNHREVHFRELAPGRYVLHLAAANNDGVWNEPGVRLPFLLQPYFWQTLWFQILAFAAISAAGSLAVWRASAWWFRRRIQQLEQQRRLEQERARERQRGEAELQRREEYFRSLIEHASDSITAIDLAGNIAYQSSSGERILGYPARELLGRNFVQLIHPEDQPKARALLAQLAAPSHEPVRMTTRWRHRDGSWRTVETVGTCIKTPTGDPQGILNARDITDNLMLEERLRQAQKLEAVGQLAGGVAHDFNNILASLIMQTELAEMTEDLSTGIREAFQQIGADARRAADLTRQLLLFGRRQVMQLRPLDLNEVVTNLTRMLQRVIREDVELEVRLHPVPLVTEADPGMVEQVLTNLVVNARDAMPHGGRLLIETAEATVDAEAARLNPEAAPGHYVCLRVTDTGTGIPPEVLPRIFEPFFTTKEVGKGSGLGLATVFGIVKQHHGWITLDNRPGRGATFNVFLPASTLPAVRPEAARPEGKPSGGKETVLLVEDEAPVRKSARQILERHGYTVLEAADGMEAIEKWRQHRETVALLLTDMVMPGQYGGEELSRQLKLERPQLKVIFLSGYSADVASQEFQLQPGDDFLQKPFVTEQLLEKIRRCLDR